jgi:MFS family permease
MLCCMTFLAQLFFGFGLNACMMFISYLSGNRYRSIVNYIHVPMVAGLMLVPIMLSGWLVTKLGYSDYFFFSTLLAPVAWVVLAVDRTKEKINNVFITS